MIRGSIDRVRAKVMRLAHADGLPLPAYQSAEAAGLDLVAAIPKTTPLVIAPGHFTAVPTGLCLHLPLGMEGQVRPRSGLAAHHGLTVLNAPGTVDSDYRGEIQVLLINHGPKPVTITRGDRVAQLIVARVSRVTLIEVATLGTTKRGDAGFGSTGISAPRPAKPKKGKAVSKTAAGKKARS
jgi:dUTP pyrophosphatase